MFVYKSGAEQYAKKVGELLHSDKFIIDAIWNNLKKVTSWSELVPESFSWMLEGHGFLKEEVRIKEGRNSGESALYRKRVVELLKRQIEICEWEQNMWLQTVEKEKCFIQWIGAVLAHWKVEFDKECCRGPRVSYFGTKAHPTYRVRSLGLCRFFWKNDNKLGKLRTRCIYAASSASKLQQRV